MGVLAAPMLPVLEHRMLRGGLVAVLEVAVAEALVRALVVELLQIQLANHRSKIEEVYGEVIERATNYRDVAIANISTVYQAQFAVLNVNLNQCMAMQQKIAQVL